MCFNHTYQQAWSTGLHYCGVFQDTLHFEEHIVVMENYYMQVEAV